MIDNYLTNAQWTSVVGIAVVGLVAYILQTSTKPTKKTVPYGEAGFFETVAAFAGNDLPWFFVRNFKIIQKNGRKNFRLQFPIPGGWYVLGDIQLIRKIFLDPTSDKASKLYDPIAKIAGAKETILTSSNNSHWKMVRKATSPAFARVEVSRMKDIAVKVTKEWCDTDGADKFCLHSFDPSREMVMLTFKVICNAGFEYDVSDIEINEFIKYVYYPLREAIAQVTNPFREYLGFFIPEVRHSVYCMNNLRKFGHHILNAYRTNPNKSEHNTLIKLIACNENLISDQQRVAEILVFLIAGHDTTGYTISSTLVFLARNPLILLKLRSDTKGLPPDEWSTSSPYFKYVVKESMRLMPVVPLGGSRITSKEYDAGNGEIIPKGATVSNTHIMGLYDSEVFGIDVEQYSPDRWYEATQEMNDSIIPFLVGIRNCIGQSLANAEIDSILPIILSRFDLHLVKDGEPFYFTTLKFMGAQIQLKPIQ